MILALCISIGFMTAGGVYLLFRDRLIHSLFGVALIGNAVNLSILVLGGIKPGSQAPIIHETAEALAASAMDPLPQALVLTAIVIGFGMLAYLSVLLKVGNKSFRSQDDLHEEEGL